MCRPHLQVRIMSTPTGAHQKCTCRSAPKVHPKVHLQGYLQVHPHVHTKSAPTPHLHIFNCTYRCTPKVHLQVCTKSVLQVHTYRTPKVHLHVLCRCAPKAHLSPIYIFAPAPKAHLPLYKCMNNSDDSAPTLAHLLCMCAVHLKRIYLLQGMEMNIYLQTRKKKQVCVAACSIAVENKFSEDVHPACCVRSVTPTVLEEFFPY